MERQLWYSSELGNEPFLSDGYTWRDKPHKAMDKAINEIRALRAFIVTVEKLEKELALTEWVDLSLPDATLPPLGRYVLTFGPCGYVVGCYNFDRGEWQAQYTDRETGEPWLRDEGRPTHWQHIKFVYPYCGDRTQAEPSALPKPETT